MQARDMSLIAHKERSISSMMPMNSTIAENLLTCYANYYHRINAMVPCC